jgi:phage-related holin
MIQQFLSTLWSVFAQIGQLKGAKAIIATFMALATWFFPSEAHRAMFAVLCMLVMIDTVLGNVNAWQKHVWSSSGFASLFVKAVVYFALTASIGLTLKVVPVDDHGLTLGTIFTLMILRELGSVMELCEKIRPGTVPKEIRKRFEKMTEEIP